MGANRLGRVFQLEDRVLVIDEHDDDTGEFGTVKNDWLGMAGDTVYAVLIDGRGEPNVYLGEQLTFGEGCPDCNAPWLETMRPCEGCGLTIEAVAKRLAS